MSHKIAKFLLEHAKTFIDRTEAVRIALQLGMPLSEIEEYLDWLDIVQSNSHDSTDRENSNGAAEDKA